MASLGFVGSSNGASAVKQVHGFTLADGPPGIGAVWSTTLSAAKPPTNPHQPVANNSDDSTSSPTSPLLPQNEGNRVIFGGSLHVEPSPSQLSISEKQRSVGFAGLLEMSIAGSMNPISPSGLTFSGGHVEVVCTVHSTGSVRRLVKSVVRGLRACQEPERATEGLGGTYFFVNELGRKVAIVKPCDEEPLAPNNPKGFVGRQLGEPGLKPTVRVGEAAIREVAAFLLDHGHFARVPDTVLVKVTHPIFHINSPSTAASQPPSVEGADTQTPSTPMGSLKSEMTNLSLNGGGGGVADLGNINMHSPPTTTNSNISAATAMTTTDVIPGVPTKLGSLQEFVSHECDTSEMGASRFAVRDVHRIGIFDVRLYNTDRHAGNMLVRRPKGSSGNLSGLERLDNAQLELIPIDHGFCLPDALEPPYFEWLHWPQAMLPFGEDELEYIRELDAKSDVEMLQRELPPLREECLRLLEVSTLLLQKCAAAGLSLCEIGSVVSRPLVGLEEEPSELEKICNFARQEVDIAAAESALEGEGDDECSEGYSTEEEGMEEEDELGTVAGVSEGLGKQASHMKGFQWLASAGSIGAGQSMEANGLLSKTIYEGESGQGGGNGMGLMAGVLRPQQLMDRAASGSTDPMSISRNGDDLLFDLDVDVGGFSGIAGRNHSLNSSGELSPFGMAIPKANGMRTAFAGMGSGTLVSASPATPDSARSVTLAMDTPLGSTAHYGGFNSMGGPQGESPGFGCLPHEDQLSRTLCSYPAADWGRAINQRATGRRRRRRAGNKARMNGSLRQRPAAAYPPPVEANAPTAVNAVFSDLTEKQWAHFMAVVKEQIDLAVESGRWKSSEKSHTPNMGMSCPRF